MPMLPLVNVKLVYEPFLFMYEYIIVELTGLVSVVLPLFPTLIITTNAATIEIIILATLFHLLYFQSYR